MNWAEQEYEREKGADRLAEQKRLAGERWVCCGEPKDGPHHIGCAKYEEPEAPQVHEDQSTIC